MFIELLPFRKRNESKLIGVFSLRELLDLRKYAVKLGKLNLANSQTESTVCSRDFTPIVKSIRNRNSDGS